MMAYPFVVNFEQTVVIFFVSVNCLHLSVVVPSVVYHINTAATQRNHRHTLSFTAKVTLRLKILIFN